VGFGCLLSRYLLESGVRGCLGCLLLRIRRVKSRKQYLGGKKVYECERLRVEIPSRCGCGAFFGGGSQDGCGISRRQADHNLA
jgi:hypothetical protein